MHDKRSEQTRAERVKANKPLTSTIPNNMLTCAGRRPESVGLVLIRKLRRDQYRKRTTCTTSRRSQDPAHARQREAHSYQRRLPLGAEGNSRHPSRSGSRWRYDLHEPRGATAFRVSTGRALPSCQAERRKGAANRPRAATPRRFPLSGQAAFHLTLKRHNRIASPPKGTRSPDRSIY
jgi:hypothetical protein